METSTTSCEVNKLQERKTDKLATTSTHNEGKNNASLHGISYQIHLGLVVLLRLFKLHKEDDQFDFELTFEDPAAGKFDDINVRYSSPKHASKGIVRIQAKHRQTMQTGQQKSKYDIVSATDLLSTKKNTAFSMGMYFESFLNTHKPKLGESQTYMLCTNKKLDREIGFVNFRYRKTSDFYILIFLQDIDAKFYQFDYANKLEGLDKILVNAVGNSPTDKNEFNHGCTTDAIKSFYDNFFLVCGSANETELYDVAIGLLKELLHFKYITTYEKLHYAMFNAINKGPKSFKPTDMEKLFKQTEDSFIREHFRINTYKQVDSIRAKYFEINLSPTAMSNTNLFEFIASKTPGTLCYRSSYRTEVSVLIVEQTVKLAKYELVLINLSSYVTSEVTKELCNDISTICKHAMNKAAMLITIIPQDKLFKFQEITKLIQEYGMKLVIVQHVKKNAAAYRSTEIMDICVDSFLVKDVTKDTRTLLFKKCINLFGTSVALENIVEKSDPLSYLFDLMQMNEQVSKSSHETKYDEINQWYVDRRFVCYKQDETDYFDDSDKLPGLEDEANTCKVNIVLNDAGFGKSSCFTKLSWRLSSIIPSSFVIRLNAVEFSTDFKRLMKTDVHKLDSSAVLKILYRFIYLALFLHDDTKQSDSTIEKRRKEADQCSKLLIFLNARVAVDDDTAKIMKLKTSHLSFLRLFKKKLNEKQLILLLDGFDEIAPDYKEIVLECLAKFAQLDGMRLVYISSRPYHFLKEFESTFPDSRIYHLEPFTENDQERALCKYIRHEMEDLESDDEHRMFETLLRDFQNLPIQFKTVPLFLRMAFDIRFSLVKKCMSSHDEVEVTEQESIDILQLIEAFVNKKLERSLMEKIKISLIAKDTVAVTKIIAEPMEKTKNDHALLALFVIFNEKTRNELLNDQEHREAKICMEKMRDASEKTGIIVEVQDNIPQFILRILAEYFAALWIHKTMERIKMVEFFRSKSYWTQEFSTIREFVDRMILKESHRCEIHLAVLNQSVEQVKKLLFEETSLAIVKDAVGRLPLHLAVQSEVLAKQLLEHMSLESINAKDDLFQWSALDYAFVTGSYEAIKLLLAREAKVNLDTLLNQICSNNLKEFLVNGNNYGTWLQSLESSKENADRFLFRVKNFLFVTRQLDIDTKYTELNESSILVFCMQNEMVAILKQLLIILITTNNTKSCAFALDYSIDQKLLKSSQTIVKQLCLHHHITLVEQAQTNENVFLQQEHNIPSLDKYYYPEVCCVHSPMNVRLPTPDYDEHDILHDGYVIEALIAKAVHYGNTEVLNYIVRKTNTTITNRLIVSVMRLLPKTNYVCHAKSMVAFQYLLDTTTDLYDVDQEGRNLLHMTAQNGCFFMMHCLIVKGFDPTLINARNGWNMFHYLAYNDDEDNRSDKSLKYLMYEEKLCWFDHLDAMIISDNIGENITVSSNRITNIRTQNPYKLNKQQHALRGMLAVFKEECINKLLTEQERAEVNELSFCLTTTKQPNQEKSKKLGGFFNGIAYMLRKNQIKKAKKTSKIIKINVFDDILVFKHQIFADYFAACWLYENKDRMRSEPFFRSWSFWKGDFRCLRDIFDIMVLRDSKGCEIHLALVNQSVEQVSKLLLESPFLALVKDVLGRLPLHLSVWNKSLYPMEQLLKTMTLESINVRDELFQWSALDYAFVTGHSKTVKKILARGAKVNIDTLLKQICSNNLGYILVDANRYGGWLQFNENTKEIAEQLYGRVVDYLLNERRLDIRMPLVELSGLTILRFCELNQYNEILEKFKLETCV